MKKCPECKTVKILSQFYKNRTRYDGVDTYCKDCYRDIRRPRSSESRHAEQIKLKFGISKEEYQLIFMKQNGCCAICSTHQLQLKRRLAVDHDHISGKIRGLLCPFCNTTLGNMKDSKQLSLNAIKYLGEQNE